MHKSTSYITMVLLTSVLFGFGPILKSNVEQNDLIYVAFHLDMTKKWAETIISCTKMLQTLFKHLLLCMI